MNGPLLFVVGTRPEAIKLAPVIRECYRKNLPVVVLTTGQHQKLDRLLAYFEIRDWLEPETFPGVGGMIDDISQHILQLKPSCVVAQGDTFSVGAAAQAAFYSKTPFVHVEAGLRSGNLNSPWPEEFIRRVASQAATINCAPTRRARDNLLGEHIPGESIVVTGNTGIDALLWAASQEEERQRTEYIKQERARGNDDGMVLITAHRRENQGGGIGRICEAVCRLANDFPRVLFFWPSHPNPAVQAEMQAHPSWPANVGIKDSIQYPRMVSTLQSCTLVMTDSGGLQEEAPTFKKPVVVLREETERQELIEAGGGVLVGTNVERIVEETGRLLSDGFYYAQHQIEKSPFGDGRAAERVVEEIQSRFGT